MVRTFSILVRISEHRRVDDRRRIDDRDIGIGALDDPAPILKTDPIRRQSGHLVNRRMKRDNALFPDIDPSTRANVP